MPLVQNFKNLFHRRIKESRAWKAILSVTGGMVQWMPENYHAFAREGYIHNGDVYACINATYRAFRGVEFGVYRRTGDGGQEKIRKGSLAKLVAKPNSRQSWSSLAGEWVGSMEVAGNAYIEGVSAGNPEDEILRNSPKELYVLRPDRMFVVPSHDPKIPIAGYEYRAGSAVINYKVQMWRDPATGGYRPRIPVLHSKYWNPLDDYYGLSPIRSASRNIDASNSAIEWNVSLTQNATKPSGIFTSEHDVSAEQAEEYTNLIRQKFSGPGNAGRPMVLGMGFQWNQIGLSPQDMDWLKGLEWNTRKICAAFGIPPQLIADEGAKTFANYSEANRAVWFQKWLPTLDMLCEDLNTWLSPLYSQEYGEEVFISYDRDLIEAIQQDRQVTWQNAVSGTGFLLVNEQRRMLGYPDLPEGNVIMVPVGVVPLNVAAAQTEMPAVLAARENANAAAVGTGGKKPPASAPVPPKPSGRTLPPPPPKPKPQPDKKLPGKKDQIIDAEFEDIDPVIARIKRMRVQLRAIEGPEIVRTTDPEE